MDVYTLLYYQFLDWDDRKAYKPIVVEIVKRLVVEPEDILILGEQQKGVASKKELIRE